VNGIKLLEVGKRLVGWLAFWPDSFPQSQSALEGS